MQTPQFAIFYAFWGVAMAYFFYRLVIQLQPWVKPERPGFTEVDGLLPHDILHKLPKPDDNGQRLDRDTHVDFWRFPSKKTMRRFDGFHRRPASLRLRPHSHRSVPARTRPGEVGC